MSEISTNKKENKVFAKDLCFYKYFLIFAFGCIFGCIWEQTLTLVTYFLETGELLWVSKSGVFYGPFNPVYGLGAILLTILFAKKNMKWYQYIFYGGLAGGAFEYLMSCCQELFVGTRSWNYSDMFLNINGRTTIPYMIVWGLLACIWSMYIYPKLSNIIESLPYNFAKVFTIVLLIFLSIDIFISWTASFRATERRRGIEPICFLGQIYDKYYTDEFLAKRFTNAVIIR